MAKRDGTALPKEPRFSVILQGTFDSDAARDEFRRAFSSIGLQALSNEDANYGSKLIRALSRMKLFCAEAVR